MKYELHPACAAWPTMKPEELRDLADDILANGMRDPLTLTPDGLLLDGRNRALACEMAGVEPATTIFDGNPWLFSLSRNKHRRHMTIDQIAMVAATLATRRGGASIGNQNASKATGSNEPVVPGEGFSIAQVAAAAGVPETSIKSAKVVLKHGTEQEKADVRSGKAKLRKAADTVRSREQPNQRPTTPRGRKTPVHSRDPLDDVTRELITKCASPKAEWRTLDRMSSIIGVAKSAIKDALKRLGDAGKTRPGDMGDEYLIEGDRDELLVRAGCVVGSSAEIICLRDENARLRAENDDLRAKLADAKAEINRLRSEAGMMNGAPSRVHAH
jgi:hypothetical protein